MSLTDYQVPTERIALPRGQEFTVRGLTLFDITHLVQNHIGDLLKAVEIYAREKKPNGTEHIKQVALIVARDLPHLVAEIISMASEEENQAAARDSAARLPSVVQINAMLTVVKLSGEEAGGLGNLFESVAPLLDGLLGRQQQGQPGTLKRRLQDSIMASGVMPTSSSPTDTSEPITTIPAASGSRPRPSETETTNDP